MCVCVCVCVCVYVCVFKERTTEIMTRDFYEIFFPSISWMAAPNNNPSELLTSVDIKKYDVIK